MNGILGKKIGMTNIFDEEGRLIPVTLIEAGPCVVLEVKTKESAGYSAVLLGFGEKKEKKVKEPQKGLFKKLKISPKNVIKELRIEGASPHKCGDKVDLSVFRSGNYVDITGTTIGKGFQGGMKRWGWSGGEAGHGSMFHRRVGSVGASSYPSRVHKGKTMPGHMGSEKCTMQSLQIVSVDVERSTLAVKGSVPGHRDSLLIVKQAKKRPPKAEAKPAKQEKDEKAKSKDNK